MTYLNANVSTAAVLNVEDISSHLLANLQAFAVKEKLPVYSYNESGKISAEGYEELLSAVKELPEVFQAWEVVPKCSSKGPTIQTYSFTDGYITLSFSNRVKWFECVLHVSSTSRDAIEKVRSTAARALSPVHLDHGGNVYILQSRGNHICSAPLGYASVPYDADNYDPTIHPQLKAIGEDLFDPFPSGRLSILEGSPGCGKTFFLRSIVGAAPHAQFVFIPPAMIPSLGDPTLISALQDMTHQPTPYEEESTCYPIVLLVEDADSILCRRGLDNMPSVSSILNLTSGIMGDLLDVRVIATTNADKSDIDHALLRSERLAHYVQVPPITHDHATRLLTKLVPESINHKQEWDDAVKPTFSQESRVGFSTVRNRVKGRVSLSDVYSKAKKAYGWRPVKARNEMLENYILPTTWEALTEAPNSPSDYPRDRNAVRAVPRY